MNTVLVLEIDHIVRDTFHFLLYFKKGTGLFEFNVNINKSPYQCSIVSRAIAVKKIHKIFLIKYNGQYILEFLPDMDKNEIYKSLVDESNP